MKQNWEVVIVGGGAAGLAAAATLARRGKGKQVLVLEQADRLGKKLLATGNGRCNLYNQDIGPKHYCSKAGPLSDGALQPILATGQLAFWRELGLLTAQQREGRVYPLTLQATSVLDTLQAALEQGGVTVLCRQRVDTILQGRDGFSVKSREGECFACKSVILATGGMAAPKLGATGDGYELATRLGHRVITPRPGLTPVRCVNPSKTLRGVRNDALVSLYLGERCLHTERGEVQFTEYGLSGIVIMDLSSRMVEGTSYRLQLDLMPDYSGESLVKILQDKCNTGTEQRAVMLLTGVIKHQLAEVILRACRIDGKRRTLGSLTEEELERVAYRIKHWTLQTEGVLSWDHAQVTCGGIPLEEIQSDCFSSRKVSGLYLVGELLDITGDCGGFNLAWAFGSGIRAAESLLS